MTKLLSAKGLALVLLLLSPIVSCKKNGTDNDGYEPGEKSIIHLNAGTLGYAPFEVVQLPITDVTLPQQEVTTNISGQIVKVAIINNFAHFIVPQLPEGLYVVRFKAEREFEFSIFIKAAQPLATATEYHEQYTSVFNDLLNTLQTRADAPGLPSGTQAALTADKQRYKALFDEYEKAYSELNNDEKMAFARTMSANLPWVMSLAYASQSITKSTLKIQSRARAPYDIDIEDYESGQQYAINKWMASGRVVRDNVAKLAAMILLAPVTGAVPIIGTIGTGIAIGYLITEVAASLSVNMADLSALLDVTFAPYDDLTVGDVASKVYDNAEARVLGVQARFRSLVQADESGTELNGTLKDFLIGVIDFRAKVADILTKMPSRFKPSVILASLKTNATTLKREVSGAYLSITNISNPQVKIEASKQNDGSFKIIPTLTGTTDQQVSFDVTYSNPNFSNKQLKRTISTTIKYAVDSTEYYKQQVLGTWTATNLESGDSYTLVVEPGGVVKYQAGQTTYNATWEVIKVGKKYYFWEYGFWHDAYNEFRVYDKGFADEGLKTPLTGFVHYNDLGGGKGPGAAIRYVKK